MCNDGPPRIAALTPSGLRPIDGVEYDGKKPNDYLSKFSNGLKDMQTVAGNEVVSH